MKKILFSIVLGLMLFASVGNAQWGGQPWGMNPWGRGAFGIGPWGSASTPTVVVPSGELTFLSQAMTFNGSTLTYNP